MLTIDLSPYVRKAAANSIPKVLRMDVQQKEHLIELVEMLLKDKSTIVLGTAVSTVNQICHGFVLLM
jgi:AP-3 complex subunit beta